MEYAHEFVRENPVSSLDIALANGFILSRLMGVSSLDRRVCLFREK